MPKDNITNPDSLLNMSCFDRPNIMLVLNKAVLPVKPIHHNAEPWSCYETEGRQMR